MFGIVDQLSREFPQLKNTTFVGCNGWHDDDVNEHSFYTFRTPEGQYIRIATIETDTGTSAELVGVPPEQVEIYEEVWKQLGHRALAEPDPDDEPHDIIHASHEFFEQTDGIEFERGAQRE